ncbi:penicillin acylase family protein [Halomonas icarae]|uniref:Penicillin amidase n=1 Tax=Halomonas icarae TaxID=2691040 RepID=A0A7X4W1H7_9GAMM|nr:penicillin acylase family protein [Halomonas icarae]MDR5903394.1 penicillin acylase family protein [Halomonas icarae]NAW14244.1 penicillin amidase [Halomonas icarae]
MAQPFTLGTCTTLLTALPLVAMLGIQPAAAAEVTIEWSQAGTPHVFADDNYGLFMGYGYAIAQDRLFQLEMTRRSTQGHVAAVLGEEYIDFDTGVRRNYDPERIRRQLAALDKHEYNILQGYADGINRWLEEIEAAPDNRMPKQFLDHGFRPEPWEAFDVAMVFIGTMINRFGDYNTEIQNQQILNNLIREHGQDTGKAIFDWLLAFYDPDAQTTVPNGEWDPARRQGAFTLGGTDPAFTSTAPLERSQDLAELSAPEKAFSNILVLGPERTDSATSILINGPQFGFYQPAYTYSIGLHGAGYNAVGNSPFGYPMVVFGHNGKITWGSTWGAADNVDIFRLELDPDDPTRYRFEDSYRKLEMRSETITVKGAEDVDIKVYRSHHGAVVDYRPDEGVAYAKQRGWEGKEVSTLMAWNRVAKAEDHTTWQAEVSQSAINVNWYYADQQGNIAYALGGHYPVRAPGSDGRLPMPGNGEYEWQGFMPFDSNPQVLNPSTGYITNWNQRPAEGMPNPDMWWYAWHEADRVQTLIDAVESQERLSADEAWQLMMDASFVDPSPRFFIPLLLDALDGENDDTLRRGAELLSKWDYMEYDQDADGEYDQAAIPLYRAWLEQLIILSLSDILPEEIAPWFLTTGHLKPGQASTGSTNISVAAKLVYRALRQHQHGESGTYDLFADRDPKRLMREAMQIAIANLQQTQGDDMDAWRSGVAHTIFSHRNFMGVPQAGKDEDIRVHHAMNRGTENNMTVFTSQEARGYEVAAPGQSGFVAPDGDRSPHYDDQIPLFRELENKPVLLNTATIREDSTRQERLTY